MAQASAKSFLRGRLRRLEALEERALSAVSAAEFAAIRAAYPEFELPENVAATNVLEINASQLSVANLKAAIERAQTTASDDLIVVRTTDAAHTITYADAADSLEIDCDESKFGAITIVGFGTKPLTLDANRLARVLTIESGKVNLGKITITGGNTAYDGGGVYAYYGTSTFANSTISGNTASYYGGGGVYALGATTFYSIVALNIANDGADIYTSAQTTKVNAYNTLSSYSAWSEGTNNYVYDASLPLFTDAENGDYTLAPDSQAIDKGENQYAYDAGLTADSLDLAGRRRFAGSAIDLAPTNRAG